MKRTIAEQRNAEIIPGFSPRPISAIEPAVDDSPSGSTEPETHSPDALMDGPIIQRSIATTLDSSVVVQDGIVSFGK
jgi:hypothetical protein